MLRSALVALLLASCSASAPEAPDASPGTTPGDTPGEPTSEPDVPAPPDEPGSPSAEVAPGCTATALLGGHPAWFHFTRPDRPCRGTAGSGRDRHILAELTRLIDSVPAGGRIDGHIFNITVDSVAQALLAAQTRGVEVWISTDGQVGVSTDASRTQYLDALTHIVYCGTASNTACISSADGAISHTKLFTFSTATAPDGTIGTSVVWLGSANQTYASGTDLYNNTVTIHGDTSLYTPLRAYLDALYAQRRQADYYDAATGRGFWPADSATVYASPEADTDLVVNRLNDVIPDATCEVRVQHASVRDSRLDVVDRLVRMKRGGCAVTVVADTFEPMARATLAAANIPMREALIHDKVFLVRGTYGGGPAYRVYTGSQNLSGSSNRRFDEIFVKLAAETGATHPVYDAYREHFDDAFASGTPLN